MKKNNLLLFLWGALALGCNNANVGGNGLDPEDLTGLSAIRIEPPELTLESSATQVATHAYKAIGTFPDGEHDLSSKVLFYLDNSGVGQFNQAQFQGSTRQGGDTKVYAQAGGITGSAHLLVHFSAVVKVEPAAGGGAALPADPSASFQGTAMAARAPELVYPNNGVMLPPNIQNLEVHWRPGVTANKLFQLSFQSPSTNVTTYTRCNQLSVGCVFALDPDTYSYVANSNSGGQPVSLTVRGGDDTATGFGESATFKMQFSQENVNGGLYYWTVSGNSAIMRVDFGSSNLTPSLFLTPNQNGIPNTCVGCHAISRDGTKMVASLGGQNDGRLVYIANMAAAPTSLLTLTGSGQPSADNRIQFASFNPDGSRFVAIYGDTGDLTARHTLYMHDGNTGLRVASEAVKLSFEPDHPDWSPNGGMIAFSRVGVHNTSQQPGNCGIELVQQSGSTWSQPATVVPIVAGKSRYNPNFAPDSSFFIYSESTCNTGNNTGDECNADADPTAKTWAVKPQAGATPVALTKASSGGVMDTQTSLSDTYPRFSPFQQKQGTGRLFWVTVSSRRKAGLRDPGSYNDGKQWLWMFAVDPDKVAAGQDGSYPGFFLPFQDLSTSNHIGQWTQRVVSGPG